MTLGEYLEGFVLLVLTVGAATFAGLRIASARLPELRGAERLAAVTLIASAALIAIHLLPAILGILGRPAVAVAALLVVAGALMQDSSPPRAKGRARWPTGSRVSLGLAALAVAALTVYCLALLNRYAPLALTNIDTVSFHVPGVARWIQSGSLWQIDQFLPGQAQGYYPGNGNVVQLAAVLPFDSEFLVRFVNVPFYAMAGVSVYATGRALGASAPSAAIAAGAALSYPAVTSYVVESPTPDAVMYGTFAAGVAFLVRHRRTGARADLLLAGLGLGVAFGTRWYGVSSVAVVVAVWIAARLIADRRPRQVALDTAWLCAPIGLAGGIWLLRNLVESGNPVFPVEVGVFGQTLFDAPRDVVRELVGWRIVDYLDDPRILSDYILPAFEFEFGLPALALAIGALAAGATAAIARRAPSRGEVAAIVVAALGILVVYVVTPYTALGPEGDPTATGSNTRYLVPALLLAGPATAWAITRAGRATPWLQALFVLAIADAIRRGVDVGADNVVKAAGGLLLAGSLVWLLRAAVRVGPIAAAAVSALLLAAVGGALYLTEERFVDDRYASNPILSTALAEAGEDGSVGISGAWDTSALSPILGLFGPRLSNEVAYVGDTRDGMLLSPARRDAYLSALERGDYDLLMIGRLPPLGGPDVPEERWATDAGYVEVAADATFTIFKRREDPGA